MTGALAVPSERLAVRVSDNAPRDVQQKHAIGNGGVLYSPEHQRGTGQRIEFSNDASRVDAAKGHDLIVRKNLGKNIVVRGFTGRTRISSPTRR